MMSRVSYAGVLCVAIVIAAPALAQAPCTVPDNGGGTVNLPPQGCGYVSPTDLHEMINGLPAGSTIQVAADHEKFFNVNRTPGGALGGEHETFQSLLFLDMNGTGALGGYHRMVSMQASCEVDTGPRSPGSPQSFPNDMFRLQGQLPPGDPDFDLLRITAGTFFGMPSPGHTTLTQVAGGNWNVDSFFDITYRIDFIGHSPGPFAGMSGSTTGTIRMQTGVPAANCPPIPPGTDTFPSTAKLVVQRCVPTPGNNCTPMGPSLVLRASDAFSPSPTQVQRGVQVGDEIPVQLIQLDLRGTHPSTGQFQIHLNPGMPSQGMLQNVLQDPGTCELTQADGFFDVFVDLALTDLGETWRNSTPLHIRERIFELPCLGSSFESPLHDAVPMRDTAGNLVALVDYVIHEVDPPFPPPVPDCFDTTMDGLVTLFGPGMTFSIFAQGMTTVDKGTVYLPGTCNPSGLPCPCPAGQTCEVNGAMQTEIVDMHLQGSHPQLGNFQIVQAPTPQSNGLVRSLTQDTYPALGFFDVFFDLQSSNQGILHNQPQPLRVQAQPSLANLPPDPGSVFQQTPPTQPVTLRNASGTPVGEIRNVRHTTGPPYDWTPPPPPDDYCFESYVVLEITIFGTGCTETITLPGPFCVLRDAPLDLDGDGNESLDTILSRIVMSGTSQCLGTLRVILDPDLASEGRIQSLAPAEFFPADSFFDVFTEIHTASGRLRPTSPAHMTTTINTLPPDNGEIYYGPGTVIPIVTDNGTVVGQILEVEHIIRQSVVCPPGCMPFVTWAVDSAAPAPGPAERAASKTQFLIGIADGGGGVLYDALRGDLTTLRTTSGSFTGAICLQNNGGKLITDLTVPGPGTGFYYLSRAGYKAFTGTWNSGGPGQVGDRDANVSPCPP